MTKKSTILKNSALALVGVGVVGSSMLIAGVVSAHGDAGMTRGEGTERQHRPRMNDELQVLIADSLGIEEDAVRDAMKDESQREAIKEILDAYHAGERSEHLQEMADALGITVEDLEAAKDDEALREQYHEAFMEIKQQEIADILGISVEDLEASKDDPELREQYKAQLEEAGVEMPRHHGRHGQQK